MLIENMRLIIWGGGVGVRKKDSREKKGKASWNSL